MRCSGFIKIRLILHSDHLILGAGSALIGQHIDADKRLCISDQPGGGFKMMRIVVDTGNNRHAQEKRRVSFGEHPGMAQDDFLIDAGIALMQCGIGNLPVHQDQIAACHGVFEYVVRCETAGLDGNMDARILVLA